MKTATALHFLSALLLTLTLTACGLAPAQAQDPFLGTFRIDLPGKSNLTTEVRDVGNHQQESRTTLTPGSAASNVGQLEIKADGTYRISGYLGLGGTRTGRWIANDEGPFSDKGGIELLEVKSANYDADQRSWFVYLENGQLVGREPPYSGFNHLLFTRLGTAP